jgi:[protein-PII] uridylyltransferase
MLAPDAVGLLAIEVAVLGVHAQDVRSARTFTLHDVAIGEFDVQGQYDRVADWQQVAEDLRSALVDPEPIREQLRARARRYGKVSRPTAARPAEPRVLVDNDATAAATIVEVRAADGIGVLHRITNTFGELGVRVEQAYVSTLGHEVADTFYVTGPDGAKLADALTLAEIGPAVLAALSSSDVVQTDDQMR